MGFWNFGRKKPDVRGAEMSVPTHLKPFFMADPSRRSEPQIAGSIRCICGCTSFAARCSRDDDCLYTLKCDQCGQDVLLFDARVHGWDALVCHMPGECLNLGEITEKCEKCGGERFTVEAWIEPAEKDEFISCVEGEFPDEAWVNAFTWFATHLTCTRCGCKVRGWADIECA